MALLGLTVKGGKKMHKEGTTKGVQKDVKSGRTRGYFHVLKIIG